MANDQELIKEVYPISILRASQQNKDEGEHWISEDVTKKWTDNPQGVSPEYPYEFCCTRYYTYKNKDNPSEGKGWQPWDIKNISLWAHYGMNATPYQLLLGNPYESIYQIEASGATREAYVIIDGDGISTGEIILQGGYENKDQKFNLKIDEISILDPINNIERNFKDSNYKTINLGDNWYCRFELSDNNGNPVIKIIGIGPNPESAVTPPSTIELAPTDSCFKCNLEGKYQKKIVIQAKNNQKHITATATWTVTAIRDKNGDGIWRYQIMPNIDRVVKMSYFKKISDSQSNHIRSVYNIGDAESVTFDIEKDTYGQAWRNITNQACRVVIKNPQSGNTITVPANGGPITVPFVQLRSELDAISNANPTLTQTLQYTVELQVVDPDYEANSEGYSVVDKCNLLFEYIVCEAGEDGKDGKDGKDGSSSVFNLSNDSGSFAYKYNDGTIKLSNNDKTTNIQYIVESNYKCCDSIKVGENTHNDSESGTCGRVNYQITKNTKDWTLEVTSIIPGDYSSVFAIPITGIVAGKEVGTATFKMVGIKDLNEDGVYSYRIVSEHAYSKENAGPDTLDITVFRDVLIEGKGYSEEVDVVVQVISKLNGDILSTSDATKVSCDSPATIDTGVSMATIQSKKGVVVKVYTNDKDYNNRPALSEGSPYHFTGEYEDIPWTAPQGGTGEIDYDKLKESLNIISCNNDSIVVTGGSIYTFRFTDIGGTSKEVTLSIIGKATNFFTDTGDLTGDTITLHAKSYEELSTLDPFSGEITYADTKGNSGTIRYTWVGDANSDGAYYDYVIEPSAQVLGYTAGKNNELEFNIKQITATCKCIKHQGLLKSNISKKDSYVTINGSLEQAKKLPEGDIITIKFQDPPASSESTDTNLYYNKTDSFRIGWYVNDTDFENLPADSISFLKIGEIKYYLVDSELIDVVPNTAIDATQNLQAYTGSGSFVIDPKELTATFEYKSDAPGFYKIRFNSTIGTSKNLYFKSDLQNNFNPIKIVMPPELIGSQENNFPITKNNIEGPYTNSDCIIGGDEYTKNIAWITYPSVYVGIYKDNTFTTLLFEDTVIRTGLDGYYWNVDENGVVSLQSNGDVMTSINQTANSIVSIASRVSPNLCEGAATKKTSLFDWIDLSNGSLVTNYSKSQIITAPNKECEAGTFSSVPLSGTQYTYSASNFELNEGYYGISLSPTSVTTGGTITVGYDGPLLYENYSAPSGSAIAISGDYNGKGIKFTASNALKGDDYILSFYASSTNASIVYVKANNTIYQFETTSNVKRYVLKLNKLSSLDVTIYKDQEDSSSSSILYISSIQFEKGSLVTDWKDYGQDVSSIIQTASRIEARVENIEGKQSQIEVTANGIKSEVATIKKGQEELKSYIDEKPTGIDMATVVNGIRTAGINIKNGTNEVENGKIDPGSGSVELTGQVIATNFMVKSGAQSLSEMRKEGSEIVMCITTWRNAKELGTNETIQNSGLSDDSPVFVIKSGSEFFVLNPLVLTNSSGEYPAIYTAFNVYRYSESNPMNLTELQSKHNSAIIYSYDEPSYTWVGNQKSWILPDAETYIGRMCTSEDFDNKTEIKTSLLLQDYTLSPAGSISAPIYLLNEARRTAAVFFVDMDIYEFKKYVNGEVKSTRNVFVGPYVAIENGDIKIYSNSNAIYKLTDIGSLEYMSSGFRTTKTITHKADSSVSAKFEYIKTTGPNQGEQTIFITKIDDNIQFNSIFKQVADPKNTLSTFLSNCSSDELQSFDENTITEYQQKYIDLNYKAFIQGDDIMTIQDNYIFS